jgi:predicted nucleic acid-binding protein
MVISSEPRLRLLDTSVILRYLTNDIPEQAEQARALIESARPLGLTTVALLEAAYALRRNPYRFPRDEIIDVLIKLARRRNIQGVGVDKTHVAGVLRRCRGSNIVSVGDALLTATAWSAGISEVYTFDRQFARAGLHPAELPNVGEAGGATRD